MGGISGVWNKMQNLSPTAKIASSLILKDAVGCYLYVSQARKNKEMTPQQRADVANYDLANGGINIGLQLLAVKPIEKMMNKFVENKWVKHFYTNMADKLKPSNKSADAAKYLKGVKSVTSGAVALLSVIICQYFIKRIVSPFLSVPAGEKSKKLGFIKPKLYEGEEFNKKNIFDNIGEQAMVHTKNLKEFCNKILTQTQKPAQNNTPETNKNI
ncbi:MAG: hypothetical protein NC200_07620 [Candidatus Gastranaerophilales bacterium]|nr:hypothetical protein [Candidatus Gastranaerophilales bacterium]